MKIRARSEQFWGDAWNGYPAARRRLMNQLVETRSAESRRADGRRACIHRQRPASGARRSVDIARDRVELVTTSVTSERQQPQRANSMRGARRIPIWCSPKDAVPRLHAHRSVARSSRALHLVALDSGKKRQDSGASVFRKIRHRGRQRRAGSRLNGAGPRNKSVTPSPNNDGPRVRPGVPLACAYPACR